MPAKRRKKKRRRRILVTLLLIIALLFGLGSVIVLKVFVVEDVEVSGNEIYTDTQIEEWIMDDEYSWNSLYLFFKYKFMDDEEIPFVDDISVTLSDPWTVCAKVEEKAIIGYVYVSSLGQYAYFDKDGFAVEISSDIIEGVIKVSGLSVETAELYSKLDIDETLLSTLLTVTQLVEKYDRVPETILISDGEVILCYGDIQVNVGSSSYLNEKILRMDELFSKIEGMTGTLHLENWTESNTDVYFKKEQLEDIPADAQTVPSSSETDEETEEESDEESDDDQEEQ